MPDIDQFNEARQKLASNRVDGNLGTELLRIISRSIISGKNLSEARDIALRFMDRREEFQAGDIAILYGLLEELGYFPYLAESNKGIRSALNYEFHRSLTIPEFVLHEEQLEIADHLSSGNSVILSAPTSFGKSLLIEEIVASKKYENIVILQPTLALIDETRKKLRKYSAHYKIVFSGSQKFGKRNLFILTPERLIDIEDLPDIDFFMIDEFYKISMDREDDRVVALNQAFYLLMKHTSRFYLLGPRISSVPDEFVKLHSAKFVKTDFATVTSDLFKRRKGKKKDRLEDLIALLQQLDEPTLIYCSSPPLAEEYARTFAASIGDALKTSEHEDAIEWISNNIHPQWSLIECLRNSTAFHHGRLPRYIARYLVSKFNSGAIRHLFCTGTLIEGVNTAAKNVIVFDQKKGGNDIDFFDFANIAGRAGRMGRHIKGNIFVYGDVPAPENTHVDFPWFTQDSAPVEILIQLDREDVRPNQFGRVQHFYDNEVLDVEIIRNNSGISPDGQLRLAQFIRDNIRTAYEYLRWTQIPDWEQLQYCCNLIWEYLLDKPKRLSGVYSGKQLAFIVSRYRRLRVPAAIINDIIRTKIERFDGNLEDIEETIVDLAVNECMEQMRTWFEFKFPKLLLALNSIQERVLMQFNRRPGNYLYYATSIESGFMHPNLAMLREFGIPYQLASKLQSVVGDPADFDGIVERIRSVDGKKLGLSRFEQYLIEEM